MLLRFGVFGSFGHTVVDVVLGVKIFGNPDTGRISDIRAEYMNGVLAYGSDNERRC